MLSSLALKSNLRRYVEGCAAVWIAKPAGKSRGRGRAVQVDPMKPVLKAPGTERLMLKYDEPLSNFALNFSLRR